jgi:tricorn protease
VPNPFVPKPAPLHKDGKDDDDDDDDEADDDKPVRRAIDFEGIAGASSAFRSTRATTAQIVAGARPRALHALSLRGIKPEGNAWEDDEESGTLLAYDFDQQRCATIAQRRRRTSGSAPITARWCTNRTISMRAIDAAGELPDDDTEDDPRTRRSGRRSGWLDLSRASVLVEPRDEWTQMYAKRGACSANSSGTRRCRASIGTSCSRTLREIACRCIRTRAELSDMIWEMLGELGTSHAYEIGGDHRRPPQYRRGFLGADLRVERRRGRLHDREDLSRRLVESRDRLAARRAGPRRARRAT